MRIAVLSGGRSSEHDVSLLSGASVAEGLRDSGHDVVEVRIERDGRWLLDEAELQLVPAAGLLGADVVFPVLHGPFGEDGVTQGLLESLDVAYVGSGVLASATAIDKLTCKRLLGYHGIRQADFVQVGEPEWRRRLEDFPRPLWVKPSRLGSSVGISPVDSPGPELDAAIEAAAAHDPRVIIEAHVAGRELECGLLGNEAPLATPPGELIVKAEWYDYEAKYQPGGMELEVPAALPEGVAERASELAARVFKLVGAAGLARCDLFFTEDGNLLVNEINTIPGFTPTSVYARLIEAAGIGYAELCDRLAHLAIERHRFDRSFGF